MANLQKILAAMAFISMACNTVNVPLPAAHENDPAPTAMAPATEMAAAISTEPPPRPTDTPTLIPTLTPSATATPVGYCTPPIDDYTHVEIHSETISNRTYQMLLVAQRIYPGPGDILRVTQGSYSTSTAASFDTHSGGGAVDISIRNPNNPNEFLYDEAESIVIALRWAGFAAWYRYPGALGDGSPPHIHAIAIGDQELSPAAIEQLTGPGGYFRGLDGLPEPFGPNPDPHGGPVVCAWMLAMGYKDLR